MLDALEMGERREEFIDWFEIEREDGRDGDVGLVAALDRSHHSAWLARCWRPRMAR